MMKKNDPSKKTEQSAEKTGSPLLERYLQKSMHHPMENVSDEVLAKAIQTLLYEEKNKHLN